MDANDHMVGCCGLPRAFRSFVDATGSIQLSNGSSTKISSLGIIPMNKAINLSNVLVVPDFHHNLFSISVSLSFPVFVSFRASPMGR